MDSKPLTYVSVCSGIEAATVAWHPLGWTPLAFAEVDKATSAVLAHRWPGVPNVGDFTKIKGDEYGAVDVLVGGTPCQDFSVAGLRAGMAGERGQLTVEFARLAGRMRPRWLVWENVPGVLSSDGGRAFGAFLGILGELGYGTAYRVLDAQHFGVPQRRRRVFVVGHLGDWRRAAVVLFERHSLSGHPPPRREAGQGLTHELAPSLTGSGRGVGRTGESRGQDPVVAMCMSTGQGSTEIGTGSGTPLVPVAFDDQRGRDNGGFGFDQARTLNAAKGQSEVQLVAFTCKDHGADAGHVSPTPRGMGHDGSHANAGGQVAVAFTQNQAGDVLTGEVMHSLGTNSNATGRNATNVSLGMAVRRLTPAECEKLQGFEPGYTLVPYGRKMMADGPRYKMLGNSMAVPCMKWIGERIQAVEAISC